MKTCTKGCYSGQKVLSGPPGTALSVPEPAPIGSAETGPHPHLLAQLRSAGQPRCPPYPPLTFCSQLHDTGENNLPPSVFVPQSISIGCAPTSPEGVHSRTWSKKVPVPSPKRMRELGVPPLPANWTGRLAYKLGSTTRRRRAKARPRHSSPRFLSEPSPANPSEVPCVPGSSTEVSKHHAPRLVGAQHPNACDSVPSKDARSRLVQEPSLSSSFPRGKAASGASPPPRRSRVMKKGCINKTRGSLPAPIRDWVL